MYLINLNKHNNITFIYVQYDVLFVVLPTQTKSTLVGFSQHSSQNSLQYFRIQRNICPNFIFAFMPSMSAGELKIMRIQNDL